MPAEWIEHRHGSGADADLGRGLRLSVDYEGTKRLAAGEPHYNVRVFGYTLKKRHATAQDAKDVAEAVAMKWLLEAQQKLAK